jgi:hypothetical protein
MNKTTTLMFVAIAAFAVVGTAVSVVPAQAQSFEIGDNNLRNNQGACTEGCDNAQNLQNNQGDGDNRPNDFFNVQD